MGTATGAGGAVRWDGFMACVDPGRPVCVRASRGSNHPSGFPAQKGP